MSKTMRIAIISVLMGTTACLFATSSALGGELVSLRNGTVYDGSGDKITSKTSLYKYASGSPVCPVNSVTAPTGQKAYVGNHDVLTYYFKNRKVGMATVVIRGNHSKGFKDAIILNFKISPNGKVVPTKGSTSSSIGSQSGSSSSPSPSGSFSSSSTSSGGNSSSGTGSSSGSLTPTASALSIASATVTIADQTYSGSALSPSAKVVLNGKTLGNGTDYTITYSSNVNAGTATATITGKGKYNGTLKKSFKINPAQLSKAGVSRIANKTYTGSAISQSPTVKIGAKALKNGSDYIISYKKNTNVGTATVILTGKGNYTGTQTKTFKITAANLSSATIAPIPAKYTDGLSKVSPEPTVTIKKKKLKKGRDYTVSYAKNQNPGMATVTVKGKGNYSGSKSSTFKLVNLGDDLARAACKLSYSRGINFYGKYAGTTVYRNYIKKGGFTGRYTDGRHCAFGMVVSINYSGYDVHAPKSTTGSGSSVYNYLEKSPCWKKIGTNNEKLKLLPGDILFIKKTHTCMYVGSSIPKEIYKSHLRKTSADRGEPTGNYVSAKYGYQDRYKLSAALGIAGASWAGVSCHSKGAFDVFRCVKPTNTKYRVGSNA